MADEFWWVATQYLAAKRHVISSGYDCEIDWQESVSVEGITEQDALQECAWVILSAGMRESVVTRHFPRIRSSFLGFHSASAIVKSECLCRKSALDVFRHEGKIDAILYFAKWLAESGVDTLRSNCMTVGISFLEQFPYIGPITSCHLAKNLGLPTAKADRHLSRMAEAGGFDTVHGLCSAIGDTIEEPIAVVDLVLWRFATLMPRTYVNLFVNACSLGSREAEKKIACFD